MANVTMLDPIVILGEGHTKGLLVLQGYGQSRLSQEQMMTAAILRNKELGVTQTDTPQPDSLQGLLAALKAAGAAV